MIDSFAAMQLHGQNDMVTIAATLAFFGILQWFAVR